MIPGLTDVRYGKEKASFPRSIGHDRWNWGERALPFGPIAWAGAGLLPASSDLAIPIVSGTVLTAFIGVRPANHCSFGSFLRNH